MSFSRATGVVARSNKAQEPIVPLVRDLLQERTGIHFEADRLETMLEKLEPRIAANGCQTFLDYYYLLKYDEKGPAEWRRVMDAFSVQETYFWREFDQVRYIVEHVVPAWFKTGSKPLRIWSAACATGEEPYSIAIALEEAGWGSHPIEIVASDASEAALVKARAGFYRQRSFRSLPESLRTKYFDPAEDGFQLKPEIRQRVQFHWANLMALDDLPASRDVQVIFCRNVFIYFSTAAIKHVIGAFAERLTPGSSLCIAASESLLKLTHQFELEEIADAFVYVRNSVR